MIDFYDMNEQKSGIFASGEATCENIAFGVLDAILNNITLKSQIFYFFDTLKFQ